MNWKHCLENWQIEIDWQGLTLTPLTAATTERTFQSVKEEEAQRWFNGSAALETGTAAAEGERRVWA
jgi:hypothetical protein